LTGQHVGTSSEKGAQITVETLQNICFELIAKSVKLWRTYSEDRRHKGRKIKTAALIHGMIINSIRVDRDIQHLKELHEAYEELNQGENFKEQLESTRKLLHEVLDDLFRNNPDAHERILGKWKSQILPKLEEPQDSREYQREEALKNLTEDEQIAMARLINKLEGKKVPGPPEEKDQKKRPECPEA